MMTLIFIILLFGIGFFAGTNYGTQRGYDQSMGHVKRVIDRLEKLYRENSKIE